MSETVTFKWPDYVVFSIMLAISSIIGLFFGIKAKRKKTASADEMLTGNHKLPVLPVALSLSASFTSATTILGIPAEVYLRGGEQWLWIFGLIPCFLITAFFIVPVFHKLHLTNAYEYLELRFNKVIRSMGSFAFSIIILVYMAAVLYAPSVALSQVTGLSSEISILTMGLICTFYTSIGGIRAVVWTDAFQLVVVWAGLLAVLFKGAEDSGGWAKVWEVADKGDRLPKFDMDPDPFVRHTFWTLLVGGCFNMMTVYGANQTNLQRYSSVRSTRGSQCALLLNLPLWILYLTVLCLLGLVMYAHYLVCDPLDNSQVSKPDQLIPLFVLEVMGQYPGLPGLFVAAIFSASISTVSSGINSLAAVTLEDVFKPCYNLTMKTPPSKTLTTIATVVLAIIFGCLTIGLAYAAGSLGKTAVMISFGIFGIVGGPLLGLIINGLFVPFINSWGAAAGMITSLIACFYVGVDAVIYPPPKGYLPLDTTGCTADNITYLTTASPQNFTMAANLFNATGNKTMESSGGDSDRLYLSYIHYATLAVLVSLFFGIIVSLVTCCNKDKDVDERTYYKYSWCCRNKSSSTYKVNYADDHSYKRNSNLAMKEIRDDHAYVNHSFKSADDCTYSNGDYQNYSYS